MKPLQLSFFTLLLLISFGSVNAVLFTPGLPNIMHYFHISATQAQQTISSFLIGYALGQLFYGPLANRFGRKGALYAGISLAILSSLLCILAGELHLYSLLVIGRFLLALGSGVGLKMTFTLLNECYSPTVASQKASYLMLAFAITPGLSVAIGGVLNTHFGWTSCFYAGMIYGIVMLLLARKLPETKPIIDRDAFKLQHLVEGYVSQLHNKRLIAGGLLMGCTACFIYVFAALAPFIAMNLLGMTSNAYGIANILPALGLLIGSLISAQLTKRYSLKTVIFIGILFAAFGVIILSITLKSHLSVIMALFIPMIVVYFGLCLIVANSSALAMSQVNDKAHGSAIMNFLNVGLATLVVMTLHLFTVTVSLLPLIYIGLIVMMIGLFMYIKKY